MSKQQIISTPLRTCRLRAGQTPSDGTDKTKSPLSNSGLGVVDYFSFATLSLIAHVQALQLECNLQDAMGRQ